jgi:hypothetical protein
MSYYFRIGDAINYYQNRGFTWVETPWIVRPGITALTHPGRRESTVMGDLVGSAEQGFLQLIMDGQLDNGNYVSAGPCFRFDDAGQPGKHPYFFKVELCIVGGTDHWPLLMSAHAFMRGSNAVETAEGHDLELNGLKIGSYGTSEVEGLLWSYGTGLAEPRYSEALARKV